MIAKSTTAGKKRKRIPTTQNRLVAEHTLTTRTQRPGGYICYLSYALTCNFTGYVTPALSSFSGEYHDAATCSSTKKAALCSPSHPPAQFCSALLQACLIATFQHGQGRKSFRVLHVLPTTILKPVKMDEWGSVGERAGCGEIPRQHRDRRR